MNHCSRPGHDPGLQRHHILPRQLQGRATFARMFASIGCERHRFEDFRENGLLLPCAEPAALRLGLPLHRGPHPRYSQLVIERVGQIEASWSQMCSRHPESAAMQAHMRLGLLQRALRRYLLEGRRRQLRLNCRDPLGTGVDFTELDAMVDALWGATGPAVTIQPTVQSMPVRARSSILAA